MTKSKRDKKLESMTAERDHWRKLALEKDEQLQALEQQLIEVKLWNAGGAVREGAAIINHLNQRLRHYEQIIPPVVIERLNDWQNSKTDTVEVTHIALLRDFNTWTVEHVFGDSFEIAGTMEHARQVAIGQLIYATGAPVPMEYVKLPHGIDENDAQVIINELAKYRHVPDQFEQRRLELFSQYWEKMKGHYLNEDGTPNRNSARTHFTAFVKRTFDNVDNRVGRVGVAIVEPQQNLLSG